LIDPAAKKWPIKAEDTKYKFKKLLPQQIVTNKIDKESNSGNFYYKKKPRY
jgi:hypothetical protein